MYRIRNVAFDEALKKYGVKQVNQLSTPQLEDLCKTLGVAMVWEMDKRTHSKIKPLVFETISYLNSQYTRDDYMPEQYWTTEQREMLIAADWDGKLNKMETGKDIFNFFSTFKLGFVNLQPGQEVEVDYTPEYMSEVFLKRPGVALNPDSKTKIVEMVVHDETGTKLESDYEPEILNTVDELINLERELSELDHDALLERARKEVGPQVKMGTPKHILRQMILKKHDNK